MRYNWHGDVIFRDTVLPNKRFVIGSPQHDIQTDIREWLSAPADNLVLKGALAQLKGLPQSKGPGDFDRRAYVIWAFVAGRVRYSFDKDARGYDDFWLLPEETLSLGVGDCEDSAILLAALMVASGISPYCVRVALGYLYNGQQLLGSHAWTVYQDEAGIWRILESTLDTVPARLPDAEALTQPGALRWYHPDFCFNDEHLWWIRPPAQPKVSPPLGLDDYLRRRFQSGVLNVNLTPPFRQHLFDYTTRVAGPPPPPPPGARR
jgi:hypothetical protein